MLRVEEIDRWGVILFDDPEPLLSVGVGYGFLSRLSPSAGRTEAALP